MRYIKMLPCIYMAHNMYFVYTRHTNMLLCIIWQINMLLCIYVNTSTHYFVYM